MYAGLEPAKTTSDWSHLMSSSNKLDISTEGLNLRLEGERSYIERAYASMRRVVAEQFYQTMLDHPRTGADTVEMDMQTASRQQPERPADHKANHFADIQLVSATRRNQPAVAKHCNPVGDSHDFLDTV